MDYEFKNNTYYATPKEHYLDKIQLELGDSKQPHLFFPQVKIMRWDNEVNASFRLKDFDNYVVSTEAEKIKLVNGTKEVHFYEFVPDISHQEDGFKFEVILKEKPTSNKIEFTIQTKGLDFFYQPPLTQQEIDGGAERPDNVVGSYAVYHKTKGGINRSDGMEYKAGKALHIYRPEAIDATGKWVYGELNITINEDGTGLMTKTIPQEFLDNATYPVLIGSPTPPVFDAKSTTTGTASPLTFSHTCTGTDRLLTLGLAWRDDVARSGGAPTYNGVAMSQAGITQVKAGAGGFPGASAEMWYLTNPTSGANTISIPNTPSLSIRAIASSFVNAHQEQSTVLDQTGGGTGTTANPSNSITPTMNLQIIVDIMSHELNTAETGRNKTLLYATDEGVWNTAAQYELQGNAAETTFTHTIGADHWAIAMASFRAKDNPTFGYESIGGTGGEITSQYKYGGSVFAGAAGDSTSITAYFSCPAPTTGVALYLHSDLSFVDGNDWSQDANGSASWVTVNTAGATISAVDYIVGIGNANTTLTLYYDSGAANQGHMSTTDTYVGDGTWTTPITADHDTNKYSIYCTYTAGGGGTAIKDIISDNSLLFPR